jgi:hypothetical protein
MMYSILVFRYGFSFKNCQLFYLLYVTMFWSYSPQNLLQNIKTDYSDKTNSGNKIKNNFVGFNIFGA